MPSGPRSIEKSRFAAGLETAKSATSSSPAASARGVGHRNAHEQSPRSSVRPGRGRARGHEHRERHAARSTPRRPRRNLRRAPGRTSTARACAAARPAAASWSASSRSIVAWFVTGSEPSSGARSSTWTSSRVRSTCARNSWPSPAPSLAPSIRPGMSAITSWRSSAVDRAEHRLERRERVVGDLRLRARQPGEQRRLAGVREAHEPGVGEQLQVQLEPALLARQATLGEPRRLAVEVAKRLLPRPPAPPRAS